MQLRDKCALITGGTSGIGLAIAKRFIAEGARVVIAGRDQERGQDACSEMDSEAVNFVQADVTQEDQVDHLIKETRKILGRIDIAVNSAGRALRKNIVDTTAAEFDEVLASNLRSTFLVCRAAIPHMKEGGSIINIASVAGQKATPLRPAYSAAKAGVIQLTRQVAIDYADAGIRVNCISPGGVDTPMLTQAAHAQGRDPQEAFIHASKAHPLGRLGYPEEIAHAAVYLASELAGFVTGSTLTVDGGSSAR